MKILKKNKTKKNKTGKNKTRKNKLTKGGHPVGPFKTVVPRKSMEQLESWTNLGLRFVRDFEPLTDYNLYRLLNKNKMLPTYDIIHKNQGQFSRDTKCVAQHANYKRTIYNPSHNFCEIDDIVAVVLGHLLEIPVYSMDGHITEDSDGNNHAFFKELSHIPLTFFSSFWVKFYMENYEYHSEYHYNHNHLNNKHSHGWPIYITMEKIRNIYNDIQNFKKEKPPKVPGIFIRGDPIYKYELFITAAEKKAEEEKLAKIAAEKKAEEEKLSKIAAATVVAKKASMNTKIAKGKKDVKKPLRIWKKVKNEGAKSASLEPKSTLQGGGDEESWGVHMPVIPIEELDNIIEKNFNPINSWAASKKGKYDAIIDGLNFMEGGASSDIFRTLNQNLKKLFDVIFKNKKNPIILLVYRGHITHSGTRLYIENDINKFILNAKNYWPSTIMDIMYVHTSITDFKHELGFIPGQETKKVRKHQGINQRGGNKGRLKKGYKYSGKKLKSGLPQIIKCKSKKC